MSNLERDMRLDVIRSGLSLGYELVDQPDELKRAIQAFPELAAKLSKFIIKKPYDLGFLYKGKYVALELKKIKDSFSFIPRNIMEMPHQWDGLRGVLRKGGSAGLLVQFKFTLQEHQRTKYKIDSWLLDLTFWLPASIMDIDHSYTLGELQRTGTLIPKTDGVYDLSLIWKSNKSRGLKSSPPKAD